MSAWTDLIKQRREESRAVMASFSAELDQAIADAATAMRSALDAGRVIYACGNGGSAGDAQHFVAELVGRFMKQRRAMPAVALTTNTSTLTAVSNDYGYDEVFARQVEGLCRDGDVLVAISTSGNSTNVIKAAAAARAAGAKVVGLTNESGGELAAGCDIALRVPSTETQRIQESHIFILHTLAELLELDA